MFYLLQYIYILFKTKKNAKNNVIFRPYCIFYSGAHLNKDLFAIAVTLAKFCLCVRFSVCMDFFFSFFCNINHCEEKKLVQESLRFVEDHTNLVQHMAMCILIHLCCERSKT